MRLFEVVLEDEDGELDCLLLFLLRLPVGSEFEIVRRGSEDLNFDLSLSSKTMLLSCCYRVVCVCVKFFGMSIMIVFVLHCISRPWLFSFSRFRKFVVSS